MLFRTKAFLSWYIVTRSWQGSTSSEGFTGTASAVSSRWESSFWFIHRVLDVGLRIGDSDLFVGSSCHFRTGLDSCLNSNVSFNHLHFKVKLNGGLERGEKERCLKYWRNQLSKHNWIFYLSIVLKLTIFLSW